MRTCQILHDETAVRHRAHRTIATPAALLAMLLLAVDAGHSQVFSSAHPERATIQAFWAKLDSAWNARDAVRFSGHFAREVSFAFVDRGQSFEGRRAVQEHFASRFPTFAPDLRHQSIVRDVRVYGDGTYLVDGTVEILRVGPDHTTPPTLLRTFATLSVMRRMNNRWTIELLRIYQLP